MLPKDFPTWQIVYYHFRQWTKKSLLERLTDALRRCVRIKAGRSPSAAIIDSQSVKTAHIGGVRGFTFRESSI